MRCSRASKSSRSPAAMTISPSTTHRSGSLALQRLDHLGEVAGQRLLVAAGQLHLVAVAEDDAAEAVPLGLVEQTSPLGDLLDRLGEHRAERLASRAGRTAAILPWQPQVARCPSSRAMTSPVAVGERSAAPYLLAGLLTADGHAALPGAPSRSTQLIPRAAAVAVRVGLRQRRRRAACAAGLVVPRTRRVEPAGRRRRCSSASSPATCRWPWTPAAVRRPTGVATYARLPLQVPLVVLGRPRRPPGRPSGAARSARAGPVLLEQVASAEEPHRRGAAGQRSAGRHRRPAAGASGQAQLVQAPRGDDVGQQARAALAEHPGQAARASAPSAAARSTRSYRRRRRRRPRRAATAGRCRWRRR